MHKIAPVVSALATVSRVKQPGSPLLRGLEKVIAVSVWKHSGCWSPRLVGENLKAIQNFLMKLCNTVKVDLSKKNARLCSATFALFILPLKFCYLEENIMRIDRFSRLFLYCFHLRNIRLLASMQKDWLWMFSLIFEQYSAVDTNPLSLYVMHPFWNTVVKVRWLISV